MARNPGPLNAHQRWPKAWSRSGQTQFQLVWQMRGEHRAGLEYCRAVEQGRCRRSPSLALPRVINVVRRMGELNVLRASSNFGPPAAFEEMGRQRTRSATICWPPDSTSPPRTTPSTRGGDARSGSRRGATRDRHARAARPRRPGDRPAREPWLPSEEPRERLLAWPRGPERRVPLCRRIDARLGGQADVAPERSLTACSWAATGRRAAHPTSTGPASASRPSGHRPCRPSSGSRTNTCS
jgi:hypothetical protein